MKLICCLICIDFLYMQNLIFLVWNKNKILFKNLNKYKIFFKVII